MAESKTIKITSAEEFNQLYENASFEDEFHKEICSKVINLGAFSLPDIFAMLRIR
ncbi:MAG: hypothetical protein LUB61_05375 [Eggerthellaceae bacterium]|nr:hypothetical protein [Eggerthellaceae bacterium]